MRLKIKLPSHKVYQEVVRLLDDNNERIFVASERHNILSTDTLPRPLIKRIEDFGGTVVKEQQYSIDSAV